MLFEIIDRAGLVSCWTMSEDCIPDYATLKQMHNAGYKFKLDKKIVSVDSICEKLNISKSVKVNANSVVDGNSSTTPKPKRKVRQVKCIQNGKVYKNMSEAGRDLGIDPAAVSYSIQVNRPTTSGYTFELLQED